VDVAAAGLLTACSLEGLAFRDDPPVTFTAPTAGSSASLPLHVDWTAPALGDDGSSFAVFVDRIPIAVGADIESVAEGDDDCAASPGCPDEEYLRERGVFTTTNTELVLDALRDTRPVERPQDPDRHEVTIVVLDGGGHRIDETYASLEFDVERSTSVGG
jgi:hypothetical protein